MAFLKSLIELGILFEAGETGSSTVDSFMKFRALKEKERKVFFTKKCQSSKTEKKNVKVFFKEFYLCNISISLTFTEIDIIQHWTRLRFTY